MIKVITFGVFDLLHLGHILLFKKAKELGDYLIVAVQDDTVIKKYKPEVEIVCSTAHRVAMVKSIKYVDEVIVYKDVDKDIQTIAFDIFAKGPDQNHLGFQHAENWCVEHQKEIVVVPRTEGISSTILRDKML